MNPVEQQRWLDRLARYPLHETEADALRRAAGTNHHLLGTFQDEDALTRLLHDLPPAPIPSNFAARVQAAIDRESQLQTRSRWREWWQWLPRVAPRLAAVTAVAAVALVSHLHYRAMVRERLAASVASIARPLVAASQAAQWPAADMLQDYEAIQELRRSAALADRELLAALAPEVAGP